MLTLTECATSLKNVGSIMFKSFFIGEQAALTVSRCEEEYRLRLKN